MGNRYGLLLSIFAGIYTILISIYSVLRHYMYLTAGYDLGIFMQSLWTTVHGEGFFFNTAEWQDVGTYSHFGVHNSPILFILLPIYRLLPRAEVLLVLQSIAVAAGALTLFRLARLMLDEKRAFYISLMYLLNPLVQGLNFFDFHPVTIAVPFIFLLPYYIERKLYLRAILVAFLVLSVKEDSGLILISIALMYVFREYGLKLLVNPRRWRNTVGEEKFILLLLVMGVLWIAISIFLVIPHFNGGRYPYFSDDTLRRYGGKVYPDKIAVYSLAALLSTAFLPLLNPKLFSASLFLWLELFLSNCPTMLIIGTQYPYMLAPMLFIISVYNLRYLNEEKPRFRFNLKALVTVSLVSMLLFSPEFHLIDAPDYVANPNFQGLVISYIKWKPYLQILDMVTKKLDESNCTIETQDTLFPHLANRINTYHIVTPFKNTYLENNSIVLMATSLSDYKFSIRYLNSSRFKDTKYILINVNDLILSCYNRTGDDYKQFRQCIYTAVERDIKKCEKLGARNQWE
ncbi:DUF2079 domain-containing protein [Thermococcus sp.]|uniref:DUF2079 domain-containing protein n=1 Tax=Thermococcus sp. TaxID=35749 RepID=UPI0026164DDC|nr:DUF2079 domain-containing protein [Thermococcus sp.]